MLCGELSGKGSRGIKNHTSISDQEALIDVFPLMSPVGSGISEQPCVISS